MTPRIAIRNFISEKVKQIGEFTEKNVSFYKLDRVDHPPHASIYLGRMNSEIDSMGGDSNNFERELFVMVDFYCDKSEDADAQSDEWLSQIETLIYRAEKNDDLPDGVEDVILQYAEFRPTEGGKQTRGDLVTAWRVEYSETISIA